MSYWLRAWGSPARPTPKPSCTEILPELLVGEYLVPDDVPWLAETLRVGAILNLQDDADLAAKNISLASLQRACAVRGIDFHRIPIVDGSHESLLEAIEPALEWLCDRAAEGKRAYVHCNAGINRAPSIAIAYVYRTRNMSLVTARTWVQERRACVPYWSALERWAAAKRR